MERKDYEGRTVWQCNFCKGVMVKRTDLKPILIRKEEVFRDEVIRKAELIIEDSKIELRKNVIETQNLINCPVCQKKMRRKFFSWHLDADIPEDERVVNAVDPLHLVIDKCIWCDLFWLDHSKIGILQYIFEKYQYD